MRKEEPSVHVRLAATNALLNSLEFTKKNFGMEAERHIIMQVVCEATQCADTHVKVAALQCLVRIMSLYYQFMEQYMGSALFAISLQAINSDVPEVALQGIEFWSNVCEEEITLSLEAEEAAENNRVPEQVSRHYAKGAVPHICPIMLEILTHQDENDDDDDWTPSKAAGVCIMLMAQCVGDTILDPVMPFLKHFSSTNWKYKEAAIMAFGSILDGPDPAKLMTLVEQAMPALIESMAEKNVCFLNFLMFPYFYRAIVTIRDTAAWTIGRVLEICPEVVNKDALSNGFLPYVDALKPHLMRALVNHEEPQVCAAAVGLVTDMCRAIEVNIAPALDDIMNTLVQSLQSPRLDKDVKVTILGCFGDIALAIGEHFERYIQIVMSMLIEASTAAVVTNPQDYDQVDYVDKLRENCVTAYTGILQGMRPAGSENDPEKLNQAKQSLSRFVQPMCEMIAKCCETHPVPPSDGLVATVAGLIGDLVVLYGPQIIPTLHNEKVSALLGRGRKSRTSKTKSVAVWATKEMRKAMAPIATTS
ncbi:HEAT repeat protein [Ancylostoma caninum]|uniref:HEAT repeat protein n=1 Tax=Ancylostoma caninum TaxID=29170 RepID=A0A368FK73_ANCCA|nr:HEAT repeat protein [Ancylostoma caninum]